MRLGRWLLVAGGRMPTHGLGDFLSGIRQPLARDERLPRFSTRGSVFQVQDVLRDVTTQVARRHVLGVVEDHDVGITVGQDL